MFSEAEEAAIRTAREERLSWMATGLRIHRCVADVRHHAIVVMGLDRCLPCLTMPVTNDDRRPLPPGDPVSWGAIIAGSMIEGTPIEAARMAR